MRIINTIRQRFRRPRSRKAAVLIAGSTLVIIGGFVALGIMRPDLPSMPAEGGAGPQPETVPAMATTYVPRVTHTATVLADPEIPVVPPQPAYVRQISVTQGTKVSKGQAVAMLEPADSSRPQAQAVYQAAQENLNRSREALNEARSAVNTHQSEVEARTAAVTAARNALNSAEAARDAARTNLTDAEQNLQQQNATLRQVQNLQRQGAVPQSELQQAQNAANRASAERDQASTALQEAEARVETATTNLENARQSLSKAQSNLAAARRAAVNAEAEVRRRQEMANQARAAASANPLVPLQSPVDGMVSAVLARPGMLATPSTPVVRITPTGVSVVEFPISDDEAARLSAGAPAVVTPSGLSNNLQGRVQGVYPTANGGNERNRVIVEVNDPQRSLKPGAEVQVQVPLAEINAVTVPATAVITTGNQATVRVVEAGGPGQARPVTVVGYEGELAIISQGLSAGERVMTSPTPIGQPETPAIP